MTSRGGNPRDACFLTAATTQSGFIIEPGQLKIMSTNADQEEAQEELEIAYTGDSVDIGFNVTYLLDVLANLKVDMLQVSLGDASSSALITIPENEEFKYVVMPMRI